jgi:two-component system, NarL family, response regulator NreC
MNGEKRIRCVLVHSHVLLRQGIRRMLEDEPDFEVVGEAGNAAEALTMIARHRPEVVITDEDTFGGAADQIAQWIAEECALSRVVFLAALGEGASEERHVESSHCVLRHASFEDLTRVIRRIHMTESVVREMPQRNAQEWEAEGLLPGKRALTAREREVLKLLAEGKTVRSAAKVLGLSVKTVDAHKFNLMRKLGIHNKTELVMWAIQKRIVKLPANF